MPLSLIVPSPFYSVVADIDVAATSERDELCLDLAGNLIDKERGLSCISRRWQRVCFFFFTVSPHQHAWPPCFAPEEEAHCQAREEGIRGFDAKILLIKAKLLQKWNDDENISLLSTRARDRASSHAENVANDFASEIQLLIRRAKVCFSLIAVFAYF